jgi:hypothetical protein
VETKENPPIGDRGVGPWEVKGYNVCATAFLRLQEGGNSATEPPQIIGGQLPWDLEQNGFVARDLQAFSIQQTGRLDFTAIVKQSDGQEVWSCEHITHHDAFSAMECANRELARRTAPEKHSQK